MKLSIVVLKHVKYDGMTVHILSPMDSWDPQDPAEKLVRVLAAGYYVQFSPIIELDFTARGDDLIVPETLAALDLQEATERADLETRIEPIRRRRRELQQLTFQSAPGQEFIPAERAPIPELDFSASIPSADDHEGL